MTRILTALCALLALSCALAQALGTDKRGAGRGWR